MEYRGIMDKMWNPHWLQIHEARAFVARQRKDGSVYIRVDVFLAELLIKALHGALRGVVVLAKVTEHDVLDAWMVNISQKASRLHIAQMSEGTGDTLFQNIGIRAFFQHFHIVVRLDDEVVRLADLLLHHLIQHADVCGNGQSAAFVCKMIAHRPTAIVHHRESLDGNAEQLERLHGFDFMEQSGVEMFCGLAFNESLQAVGMRINRYGTVFGESLQPQHMVDVVVSNQYGLDLAERYVVLGQQIQDLLCTDAHIHQNALVLLAHIIAIAAAARGKTAKNEGRKTGKEIHLIQIWPQK